MTSVHARDKQSNADSLKAPVRLSLFTRLRLAAGLIAGLRKPDFQAAGTFAGLVYGNKSFIEKWCGFIGWGLRQTFVVIPDTIRDLTFAKPISNTPMWLIDANPLANHPWGDEPEAALPREADTVVIGAGFTGGAVAYHWSKRAPADRLMVVLDLGDPASGSSGRNEGLVVMGRYFKMVRDTVRKHLPAVRADLSNDERDRLAEQFAGKYCEAAYKNADLIAKTIETEGFDCDYAREGWVQGSGADRQAGLDASVLMAQDTGFTDWSKITPQQVLEKSGMHVRHNAGYSIAAASWHPAKWVWCLMQAALKQSTVKLYTRTRVSRVEDEGEHYLVHTARGTIKTRHVVNATEAYTPAIDSRFHDAIIPMQEQAACGDGGPEAMPPHVGVSAGWFFAGRYGRRVLFGSGGSRLPDHEAGRNRPSRFLSRFVASEMKRFYGRYRLHMTHEWSGTVGYTADEYPIVGLIDGNRHHIIGGMCGSGSGVSFNGGRCIVNRILAKTDEADDYPEEYFAPSRLLDPANHPWPAVEPA